MTKTRNYKLRKDRFTKARGGSSKFILLSCGHCQYPIALYQKDGPGNLFRLYLDRIYAPKNLAEYKYKILTKSDLPALVCPQCRTLLATSMLYKPEARLALRLVRGAVRISNSDGTFPPQED